MKSFQGHLLIASPRLTDPNFARAVVLLVQHGAEGALGLILNRPLETTIREVCDKVLDVPCALEAMLYQGGPCEGPLMVVHTHEAGGEIEVLPGLHFTAERGKIEQLLGGADEDDNGGGKAIDDTEGDPDVKFFVGYAGWGAGQLESELETGSWLTAPAEKQHVFGGGDKQWSKLTTWLTAGIDPACIPDDPSMN